MKTTASFATAAMCIGNTSARSVTYPENPLRVISPLPLPGS